MITSFPTLWPNRWRVYISSISFVRPPFYIRRGAGLLTSSASGAARGTRRKGRGKGGGGLIISPRFNYVSLQMLSCHLMAQVKTPRPPRVECGLSHARPGRASKVVVVGGGRKSTTLISGCSRRPQRVAEVCRGAEAFAPPTTPREGKQGSFSHF